jgi:hypothetical protein
VKKVKQPATQFPTRTADFHDMRTNRPSLAYIHGAAAVAAIQPTSIYGYPDKLQIWLFELLTKSEQDSLRKECGYLHVKNIRAKFDRSLVQRLHLFQPSPAALIWLAARRHLVNQIEMALDWTHADASLWDDAFETLLRFIVKSNHGKQRICVVHREKTGKRSRGVTWYSGQRWKHPNVIAIYAHRPCKITGEILCNHIEWRMYGAKALRRAGIHSLMDVVTLDHHEFWRKRLRLKTIDRCKLGRYWRRDGRPERPRLSRQDATIGGVLIRACLNRSTQSVIDHYRLPRMSRCLKPLPVDHLLPASRG